MNKDRRKLIQEAITLLQEAQPKLSQAKDLIEAAGTEEREFFDNMNENLQGGDKGQQADNAATQLEEVASSIEEFDIDELIGKLEDASQ